MKPTRRGFLAACGVLIAAPVAGLEAMAPMTYKGVSLVWDPVKSFRYEDMDRAFQEEFWGKEKATDET